MLDIVKFKWQNTHGYWIPNAWSIVITDADEDEVRQYISIGRPGLRGITILDRITIPEELRLTGRVSHLLSKVILYDPNEANYSAREMLEAMVIQSA